MYIQFKYGFIEADRWDGSPIPVARHQTAAIAASGGSGTTQGSQAVIVVRSRERETIDWVVQQLGPRSERHVLWSPRSWDYAWRCYLPAAEWAEVLSRIVADLDYRNFKSWSHSHSSPEHSALAHDIWTVAYERTLRR